MPAYLDTDLNLVDVGGVVLGDVVDWFRENDYIG